MVIAERAALSLAIQPGDWELLREVAQTKQVREITIKDC